MEVINDAALRVLKLFGVDDVAQVVSTVGCEQEYFLIDEEYYYRRPDLMTCGRTLFGAKPPRGQELDDHYFGSIPDRVLSCMLETEKELYRLGVPVKTRHNEVAPSQYEIAPIFENTNIAADHQQLIMLTLQRIARKHGMVCLLHEKPFAGLNGSGKHNNWSMGTDTGLNLLEPGDNPHDNMQFLFFCAAVIKAVHRHQDLLRISVASAGNDHRLGANEAPPAIISVFLGEQLEDVYRQIDEGDATESKQGGLMGLGVKTLPELPRHAGDRNRTSPFAFTGNKFEFRAVGSAQSISFANTVLNSIVAEALGEMADHLESEIEQGIEFETAVADIVRETIHESKAVVFGGDNYSEEWHEEAARRGLLNLRNTVDALERLMDDKNVKLFEKAHVLSETELASREEVFFEQYFMKVNIEAETTESMARTLVMPAATRYLKDLVGTIEQGGEVGISTTGVRSVAEHVAAYVDELQEALTTLIDVNKAQGGETIHEKSRYMAQTVIPAMNAVRHAGDRLERIVANDLWPMPTYRDILFVK
jgi:glutamine synthetase